MPITFRNRIAPFPAERLEAISKVVLPQKGRPDSNSSVKRRGTASDRTLEAGAGQSERYDLALP